jgi:hypothetical protein
MVVQKVNHLEILSGWKDVATYLGKGVRTVQRYERTLGLPIRRPAGKQRGSVIATKAELDAWVSAKPLRDSFLLSSTASDHSKLINEFRENMAMMRRLRQESADLRKAMSGSLQLLRSSIMSALPESEASAPSPLRGGVLAEVLAFEPRKRKAE